MESNTGKPELIMSEFADDPDMCDLVREYVGMMPRRIEQMTDAFEQNRREQLIRLAHQLKGSGGGYGFPILTDKAGKLEHFLHDMTGDDLAEADAEFRALLDVCSKLAA